MRIELRIDGGIAHFPGLAKPLVVDSAQLADDDRAQAERLCRAALDTRARTAARPSSSAADARRYRVTIEMDGVNHELAATDPISTPAVARLIEFLEAHRTG